MKCTYGDKKARKMVCVSGLCVPKKENWRDEERPVLFSEVFVDFSWTDRRYDRMSHKEFHTAEVTFLWASIDGIKEFQTSEEGKEIDTTN